jgi:hypothetical protein
MRIDAEQEYVLEPSSVQTPIMGSWGWVVVAT